MVLWFSLYCTNVFYPSNLFKQVLQLVQGMLTKLKLLLKVKIHPWRAVQVLRAQRSSCLLHVLNSLADLEALLRMALLIMFPCCSRFGDEELNWEFELLLWQPALMAFSSTSASARNGNILSKSEIIRLLYSVRMIYFIQKLVGKSFWSYSTFWSLWSLLSH